MSEQGGRRLRNGRTVAVHRNRGLRKICGCVRRGWAKCPHAWHLNFQWRGEDHRFSLDKHAGRHIDSKTEADALADGIREAIRSGTFSLEPVQQSPPAQQAAAESELPPMTFETVAATFVDSYGKARGKRSWGDDESVLRQVAGFTPPWPGAAPLGTKPVEALTEEDLEAFLRHLRELKRTTATLNHYVGVFRALDRWLTRKRYRTTPLLSGESEVVRKVKANKRSRRLDTEEESNLLAASPPHLQRVIVAALETCARVGEISSLQWKDVFLKRGDIVFPAEKTKTATPRTIPISGRLRGILEMARNDPDGEPYCPAQYVFGNEAGEKIADVKRAWQTAVLKAHGHSPSWTWAKARRRRGREP